MSMDDGSGGSVPDLVSPGDKTRLILPDDESIRHCTEEAIPPNSGVQTVEGDGEIGALATHVPGHGAGQPHRGVHRDRESDGVDTIEQGGVPILHGQVHRGHLDPCLTKGCGGGSEVNGLTAQLVGGDEE